MVTSTDPISAVPLSQKMCLTAQPKLVKRLLGKLGQTQAEAGIRHLWTRAFNFRPDSTFSINVGENG